VSKLQKLEFRHNLSAQSLLAADFLTPMSLLALRRDHQSTCAISRIDCFSRDSLGNFVEQLIMEVVAVSN
jgi:hypothetical protein